MIKTNRSMKKKISAALLVLLMLVMCSCGKKDYITTITYRIYYPGNTVTKNYTHESTSKPCYYLTSDRGSNSLHFNYDGGWSWGVLLENTSAPIEVVSFTTKSK